MMSVMAFAQTGGIKGKVIDEANLALPGSSVTIEGTTLGATTDGNGNYTITGLKAGNYTVTAKFLGYISFQKTVAVSNSVITVDFALKPQNTSLNEVVVIGYGTTKKKDLTGAIATVTEKDFNTGVNTTPEQLIQGKVAGVSIISNSGAPGAGSTIRIRGGASINGSNDPLIVIDGVPVSNNGIAGAANALDLINPNDIESFSILKDASAAAIYGNRASNGVILITTKKGKSGKPVIDFTTQVSIAKLPKEASVLSAAQFRDFINKNDTTQAGYYRKFLGNANTDWQKQIYQTSVATDNTLSVSGSAKNLPYRVSAGYLDQNGILKTSSLERYTGSLNLSPSLFTDHLKINFNVLGTQVKQRFANESAIGSAVAFNPTVPVYSGNSRYEGYWQWTDPDPTSATGLKANTYRNPVGLLNENTNRSTVYRAIASLAIDYRFHFLPDLHANINLSYDGSKGSGTDFIPDSAASNYRAYKDNNGVYHGGNKTRYKQTNSNKLFEGYLSYNKNFKEIKSHLDAVAGYSFQDFTTNTFNYNSYYADGFQVPNSTPNFPVTIAENRLESYYGRLIYTYDDKYVLSGTIRDDYSSRFAEGLRSGVFPSVSFAWKIKQESFMKSVDVISDLKLRMGYGVTGNQEGIGNYDYLADYSLSTQTAQYQFGDKFYQGYRPAAYYFGRTWEQTATANIALDYGLMNNRVTGSIDFYSRKTKNLLALITQAAGTNFSNQIVGNIGNMENKGVEFSINAALIQKPDITWNVGFNFTYNQNKITSLNGVAYPGQPTGNISGGTGSTIQINSVGHAINSFLVYQQVYGPNGKPLENTFVDRNGDGTINSSDLYYYKSPDPKAYFGLNSDFSYKKWNAGFVARASLGNYVYNNVASNTGTISNFFQSVSNGFINNGSTIVLQSGLLGNTANDRLSDYYIQNASFFRMDNVHLGYNFGKVFKNTGDLRVSANVQNVFIITNYNGVDPEINNGIDNNFYPRPRTYVLGLNLNLR
jgi:iron complex outermembrane receptor protein